ncbi:hypothetical protein [Alkalicoccus urumqiensis]|uniref:Uncharacterized protein n=1 Tax=Alkalicoccus urumqiensis TaxID=1548213 RepID=A0A2P6MHC5_ALKUR|nr:hypothetical protein [Alkalicoccus urumqiensis]PRO65677.1 hypothetical protein C6I21_09145 [Alkalicoccus urumqiensis]
MKPSMYQLYKGKNVIASGKWSSVPRGGRAALSQYEKTGASGDISWNVQETVIDDIRLVTLHWAEVPAVKPVLFPALLAVWERLLAGEKELSVEGNVPGVFVFADSVDARRLFLLLADSFQRKTEVQCRQKETGIRILLQGAFLPADVLAQAEEEAVRCGWKLYGGLHGLELTLPVMEHTKTAGSISSGGQRL